MKLIPDNVVNIINSNVWSKDRIRISCVVKSGVRDNVFNNMEDRVRINVLINITFNVHNHIVNNINNKKINSELLESTYLSFFKPGS